MKKHNKSLSLEDLTLHQQRIRSIINRINQYSPTFHLNKNYSHARLIDKIKQSRQAYQDKIFEQNMKIIQRLQSVQSKINIKQFPPVNFTARKKRKLRSLSEDKFQKYKKKIPYSIKDQDTLFKQNIQIIQKIESAQKKIVCWQRKTMMKSRIILQKRQQQKRNQILKKFNEISKQLSQIRVKRRIKAQNSDFQSPYLKNNEKIKQNQQMKKTSHTVNQFSSFANKRTSKNKEE